MTALTIDALIDLLATKGEALYGGEAVTQREHALQAAALAVAEDAPSALIVAALCHDLGHLLHRFGASAADRGIDDHHEAIGGKALAQLFGPEVSEPVRLHVDAKRWLCASDSAYAATLSPASVQSLALQGGPFDPVAAAAFIERPFAREAVRLRRWDDDAKVAGLATPSLADFRPYLEAQAARRASTDSISG
jgi:phosphonate degradation associated HDIG domain protein